MNENEDAGFWFQSHFSILFHFQVDEREGERLFRNYFDQARRNLFLDFETKNEWIFGAQPTEYNILSSACQEYVIEVFHATKARHETTAEY